MYYRVDDIKYKVGDITKKGVFGENLEKEVDGITQKSGLLPRETDMENIRQTSYEKKPSRFNCSFAFLKIKDAEWYIKKYLRKPRYLTAVQFTDSNAPEHIGNFYCLPCPALLKSHTKEEIIHSYWRGNSNVSDTI